ncbi:MAG: acetyl-CoA acetyltransferase [Pseudomonadota bacterium]
MAKGDMPVLVGAGQTVSHWRADDGLERVPTYVSLASEAVKRAIDQSGVDDLSSSIDTLAMVRTFEDSVPNFPYPYGRAQNLPRSLAKAIGANPTEAIYTVSGGQSPQSLVNEMAARIHDGSSEVALVVGAEITGATKAVRRAGLTLDLSDETDGQIEDRGMGPLLLTRGEIKHGIVKPAYFYALFENAIAARKGESRSEHRRSMAELFKPFADVAAVNPYSQFPTTHSIDFLAEASEQNYPFADPFLKWHMAQDAVNQAAAVLLMSESRANELQVPETLRVYLRGAGEAVDVNISERERLDGSWAMEVAVAQAFEQAECSVGDLALLDLYSCFPCAVTSGCAALGIDPHKDDCSLTLTGGLPFFGGPGNNYSLHAIASMYEACLRKPDALGLVLANGGWMTKEAAAIYSKQRPGAFTPSTAPATPTQHIEPILGPATGIIETYTLVRSKGAPRQVIAFVKTEYGDRLIATSFDPETVASMDTDELAVGRHVTVSCEGEVNTLSLT